MTLNSIVLYDLFYALYAPKHHTDLYRLMKLDAKNTGPRFRCGRAGKSYFPRHEEWLENALYDVPEHKRSAWLAPATQPFPDPSHANLTLASHLYNLLLDGARKYPGGIRGVYDTLIQVCYAHRVPAGQMRDIAAIGPDRLEDVLFYVVRCAKNANDSTPLPPEGTPEHMTAAPGNPLDDAQDSMDPVHAVQCIEHALACLGDGHAVQDDMQLLHALSCCNALLKYAHDASDALLHRLQASAA